MDSRRNYPTSHPLRLPAFGRRLREHGKRDTYWIAAGADALAWAADHPHLHALAAPLDDDPATRDWRQVAGSPPVCVVAAGELHEMFLEALAAALLRDGAGRVLAITGGRDSVLFTDGQAGLLSVLSVPPGRVFENSRAA